MARENPRKLKRVVIKEELVALTGDWLSAVILNQFLYWGERVKDYDKFIEEEKRRDPDLEVPLTHGWIYKTAKELKDELMVDASGKTVRRRLIQLKEAGWIDERNNPKHKWDQTLQYRPNLRKIIRDLHQLGYALDGYTMLLSSDEQANPPNRQIDDWKGQSDDSNSQDDESKGHRDDSNVHGDDAIPEITTEITETETTTETTTTNTTEKDNLNDEDNPETDVVVALTNLGISQKIAKELATEYSAKHIQQKIDYLNFEQESHPGRIESPRGWLRSAIEQDYGPPGGYRPRWRTEAEEEDKYVTGKYSDQSESMQQQQYLEQVMEEIEEVRTLEQGLALFEAVEMPARDLAAETRKAYKSDLEDLIEFLTDQGIIELTDVGLQDLEGYQAEMDRRDYAASTRRRKVYAIRTFFHFLHRHGVVAEDVADELIPPRPKKREPRFLSKQEYQKLLRACSHKPRDAAIIEVFLQTGMRLSELARLTLSDVDIPARITRDPDNVGTVRVTRKGGSTDTIPLNYKACQALDAWLKIRPDVDHDALFVTKFKTPLSKRAIQAAVKKYLDEAGIEGASVHTLRHTMATHHVAQGTDPKTLQETLGHESIETTAIYIALAKKAQRKALQEHAL